MRIAFITYEFPPDTGKGGIGTYVKQIASALINHDFDIHVFAGSPYRTELENMNGIRVHWIKCIDVADYKNKVVDFFVEEHTNQAFDCMESPEIGGNAWMIKKVLPNLPLIVRLHAPDYLVESLKKSRVPLLAKLRFFFGALRRFKWDLGYWRKYNKEIDPDFQFIQLADYITAPSASMKNWAVNNWGILPSRIDIIPNIFSPSIKWLQIPIDQEIKYKRIVFFGRLNVLKGLVNATMAIKKILNEFPDWKFRVIGDDGMGPSVGSSMKAWMQEELKPFLNQVEFIDGMPYEDLPNAVAPSEIVILPSLFESFSYTCAEAMAAGKAIIGSKNGGMADLLENESSGLLVNPFNHQELYAAIKKTILNNDLRFQMSNQARARILTEFDSSNSIQQFISYYHSFKIAS